MNKIDCFGDFCPIPLLKAQKEYKKMDTGESFTLITDHSCVVESIKEYFNKVTCSFDYEEVFNGVWEITVTKH
ncbi:transcriptional regulator [Vallitalea longa]|uniref:Transcriptional regulator n=1 Tax=Vallitalea longa TaxID=2936439 RepID=A0A9W5YDE2_9FIRM|nr:sulfurtransferase TusA family protein [Vallitalea longa]GKX32035.1 transcriptional regulator [Vallitalea longa]